MRMYYFKAFVLAAALLFAIPQPQARSWDDLDEGEVEIYGREREEKLPLRLFFVQKEQWQDHESFHALWLYGYTDYPRYRSDRLLPFYYRLQSKVDNRYRFISPVFFHQRDGADNDRSLLWLYYWGEDQQKQTNYSWLLPLYYDSNRRAEQQSLFVSLPYARDDYRTGRDSTLLWLIYWGSDDTLASKYATALPLFYHRVQTESERTIITPLFWYRRSSVAEARYLSWGAPIVPLMMYDTSGNESDLILFYLFRHRRRADSTLSHLLPLYYYSGRGEYSTASYLFPLIWVNDSPERSSWFIFPLFYSAEMSKGSTKISPVYVSLTDEASNFRLLFPLYLNYRTRDYSLHVNAAGISLSEEELALAPASLEFSREKIVLDWNLGWFYNLLRISSRHTLRFGETPVEAPDPVPNPAGATAKVGRKRERTRADSESFFGWYMLFGATAYERADHYRHFRLLPLSWLTWSAKSDEGLQTVVPVYVRYKDEDSYYLVVFPFYGGEQTYQKDCTGSKTAWLIIGYWDEFECESQTSEQTVVWPVYNHYRSPTEGGFRIFPLFWKKWNSTPDGERQVHFSPLHYTRVSGETFSTVSWLFYRNRSPREQSFGAWGLFHIARSESGTASTTYILPVYYHRNIYNPGGAEAKERNTSTVFTFAALFWRMETTRDSETLTRTHISPLYLWYRQGKHDYFYSWLWYRTATHSANTQGIPLLYHQKSRHDNTYTNFYLFPYYASHEVYGNSGGGEHVTWVFPVFFHKWRAGYSSLLLPLIGGRTIDTTAEAYSWHAVVWTLAYDRRQTAVSFNLLYGLLHSYEYDTEFFSWHLALAVGFKRQNTYLRHHLLPLWWYSRQTNDTTLYLTFLLAKFQNEDDGNRIFRALLLGILYYQNSDYNAYEQTLGVALGTIYYHNKYPERHFDSYGSLYGLLWHYETEDNYRRLALLTFLYIRTETEKGVKHRLLGIPL